MSQPTEHESDFVERLEKIVTDKNRGALASLRRGLGKKPGEAPQVDPFVLPWLAGFNWWQEPPYFLVASLFAYWHQGEDRITRATQNLGASLAKLRADASGESVERRFVALLNCHRDDLPTHLRHAIGLLKSKGVPVNWSQLLHDVKGWTWPSRDVQRDWARAFWQGGDKERDGEAPAEPADQPDIEASS